MLSISLIKIQRRIFATNCKAVMIAGAIASLIIMINGLSGYLMRKVFLLVTGEGKKMSKEQLLTDKIMTLALKMFSVNDIFSTKYRGLKNIYDSLRAERSIYIRGQ